MYAQEFEITTVYFIKSGKSVAIDIKNSSHYTISYERNHNLGTRLTTASYMSGKQIHIGHNLCLSLSPRSATNTTPFTDARASHIALKGAKDELLSTHKIKAYPKPSESLAQGSCRIG